MLEPCYSTTHMECEVWIMYGMDLGLALNVGVVSGAVEPVAIVWLCLALFIDIRLGFL